MEMNLNELLGMAKGFASSQLLLTAVRLEVFTELGPGPLSGAELRRRLELHPRGAGAFLDALVSHGLLRRTGEMYANAPVAARHLDARHTETYLGGYLGLNGGLYWLWPQLETSLRTGRPCTGFTPGGAEEWGAEPGNAEQGGSEQQGGQPDAAQQDGQGDGQEAPMEWSPVYVDAMAVFARAAAPVLARSLDWSRYETFVDVGGSNGTLACELVRLQPHLRGTCVDLPALKEQFDALVGRAGAADKVAFQGGDFFEDPLPETDAVIMGRILHNWSEEDRLRLLRRAYDALRPGGTLLIFDQLTDECRQHSRESSLASLDQLLFSESGSEYTFGELSGWLGACGFRAPSVQLMDGGPEMLALAGKPE
ncbi:methyltransferase [Streptomyces huasconensis]|uniref:Methyltransferase n=1 Tax=Streptomyces huasconensis TaxID=1854574 RepID=A0ABV3M7W5_9ACTN